MSINDGEMKLKKIKLLVVMLFSIAVAACGGGGDSGSAAQSGTAAEYFTKNAVGNTWTYLNTDTSPGQLDVTATHVDTISGVTSGVVTLVDVSTNTLGTSTSTFTRQIDGTGALTETAMSTTDIILPATFTVGTSWTMSPSLTATIAAFNVTRTVPAGTFTDCLQVNVAYSAPYNTNFSQTFYISPTAGNMILAVLTDNSNGATRTYELQSYVANP